MERLMVKKNNRKNEHVSLSEKFYPEKQSVFSDIHFVHHSLPQTSIDDVNLNVNMDDLSFDYPFFINAMTGGSNWTKSVNEKLAIVARETNLAMATGSVSAALKDSTQEDSYRIVRDTMKDGLVIGNLGAGHGLENAKKVVDLLEANAFQIHVNAPQEIVMPEGDRNFTNWVQNIEQIVNGLDVPVIVKEVGFGMSKETIQLLESIGVKYIDISGAGGTNFAQIENYRRKDFKLDDFEAIGQSTPISILEANAVKADSHLIASGGIRKPMDIVKALALGTELVGISSQILHLALRDTDKAIQTIEEWKEEIKKLYTILGATKTTDLTKVTDLVITGDTANWCQARDIDIKSYANRSVK